MNDQTAELAVWAEVDLGKVRRNVERLKGRLRPETRLLAVVKADGYGHGAVPCARAALAGGAAMLGVARVPEGAALREAGIEAPILLLAEQPDGAVPHAVALGLVHTVYTRRGLEGVARAARAAGRTAAVHLKVDTGMHRYGAAPADTAALVDAARSTEGIALQGIWSHFAVAEDVLNPYTKQQFEVFCDVLDALGGAGEGLTRHLANSAGLLTFPEAHFDLVRTGIAVYGIHPSPELADRVELEPAMAFKSRVGLTKWLAAGESISYGQRYVMPAGGLVASIPAGYADGVRRALTNAGEVLIGGRRHRISGTVTMDHVMVDAGTAEIAAGDEVVLLGRQGAEEVTAHDVARALGTIPYEVVCGISARVPRVYLRDPSL
ncbi:MAG TPA: alanine racemase [Actinomycetota bacterium]|nr:alanine racemase [Actinomycetota bacterium]